MIKCLIIIQIELEFGNVGFWGEGKTGVPGEKPLGARTRTNNKLNPHLTPSPGIEPGPLIGGRPAWEANAQPLCHPCFPDLFRFRIGLRSVTWQDRAWQDRARPVSRSGVTRGNSGFFTTATVASCCRSRKRFYFSWNLSRNGSSKSFTKPTMLHGATPAETCFAALLHTSFS